jgi:CRP/FNR family transcriptional regulator, cyclic AMP receptor protein
MDACGEIPQRWHERTVLGQLPPAARDELLQLGTKRTYGPGYALVRHGEIGGDVFVLLSGRVKVMVPTEDGRTSLLAIRIEGELIGELGSLDDEPRSATVLTVRQTVIRKISQRDFSAYLRDNPAAGVVLSRSVGAKLRWATRRRVDFNGPVELRLTRVLYELATLYGTRTGAGVLVDTGLTQVELAGLIGAAEPSVQKAFAALRSEGLVSTGYRRYVVLDLPRLRSAAQST